MLIRKSYLGRESHGSDRMYFRGELLRGGEHPLAARTIWQTTPRFTDTTARLRPGSPSLMMIGQAPTCFTGSGWINCRTLGSQKGSDRSTSRSGAMVLDRAIVMPCIFRSALRHASLFKHYVALGGRSCLPRAGFLVLGVAIENRGFFLLLPEKRRVFFGD